MHPSFAVFHVDDAFRPKKAPAAMPATPTAPTAIAIVRCGELVPAVWRAGRRLSSRDLVATGDELELVTAIAGG